MCQSVGWTWDYVEQEMDLVRLKHFGDYWAANPPVHVSVARYLGIKADPVPAGPVTDGAGAILDDLLAL